MKFEICPLKKLKIHWISRGGGGGGGVAFKKAIEIKFPFVEIFLRKKLL